MSSGSWRWWNARIRSAASSSAARAAGSHSARAAAIRPARAAARPRSGPSGRSGGSVDQRRVAVAAHRGDDRRHRVADVGRLLAPRRRPGRRTRRRSRAPDRRAARSRRALPDPALAEMVARASPCTAPARRNRRAGRRCGRCAAGSARRPRTRGRCGSDAPCPARWRSSAAPARARGARCRGRGTSPRRSRRTPRAARHSVRPSQDDQSVCRSRR